MSFEGNTKFFTEHGYLPPIRMVEEEVAYKYHTEFNKLEKELGVDSCKMAHKISSKSIFDSPFGKPFVWEIVSNEKLLEIVSQLLGPDILLLNNTSFFVKYGLDIIKSDERDKFIAWHQDLTYMRLNPANMLTAWYAIDDANEESGCVSIIPNSHKQGVFPHKMTTDTNNMLNNKQEAMFGSDIKEQAISVSLKKGEILIFDGWLLHGSGPNTSYSRRCGLSMRFVPTYTSCGHPMISTAILMKGKDLYNNYRIRSAPYDNKDY